MSCWYKYLKTKIQNSSLAEMVTTMNKVSSPTKRTRRTRSMTRSPSPVSVKQAEPELEVLPEENSVEIKQEQEETKLKEEVKNEEEAEAEAEDVLMENQEEAAEQAEAVSAQDENSQQSEIVTSEETSNEQTSVKEETSAELTTEELEVEPDTSNQEQATKIKAEVENTEVDAMESQNEAMEIRVNEEIAEEAMKTEETEAPPSKAQADEAENKNDIKIEEIEPTTVVKTSRSHSRSAERTDRSRSPHRSISESGSGAEQAKDYTKDGFSAEDMKSVAEDEPFIEENQFGLSWFDSDLHLTIDPVTFNSAKQLSHDVFALVWSGARANFGVREGKVCFEVRLSEETGISKAHKFREEANLRGFRFGFSLAKTTCLQLGESEMSFAYCESGKMALNNVFTEYGKPFGLDDVVACYLDLESSPATIKYTLNGEDLGVAFEIDKEALAEEALFPHVLCKGYEFQVNFADNENLLANVERQTRRRLKPKAVKPIVEVKSDATENETVAEQQQDTEEEKPVEENESLKTKEATEEEQQTTNGEKDNEEEVDHATEVKQEEEKTAEESDEGPSPNKRQKLEGEQNAAESNHSTENEKHEEKEKEKEVEVEKEEEEEDEYEDIVPVPREPVNLLDDYELIALIPEEKYVAGPQRPESRKECEIIILIGLPGAGKTHWTLEYVKNKPEKRYDIIGADALIAKMNIDGEPRKTVHKGSWDILYESCINCLSLLEEIAVKRRRNFILDQTNVYASVQRRKMKAFSNFKRTAIVCLPNEEELKRRIAEKQEKGAVYCLREGTLANLQANFSLPSLDYDWFDEIVYTDLSGDEAKEEVKKINEKGKKASDATRDKNRNRNRDYQKRDDRRRFDDRRRDYRSDHRSWNDRRGPYASGGGGGGSMGGPHNGSRWGPTAGGSGNGMMGGYHRSSGGGSGSGGGGSGGWREGDRGYGGGGGGSGGGARGNHMRSYDGGNRQQQRYYGGQQNQSNWMQNRNRYDDRYNRPGGGSSGGNRHDSYGGGNSGGGRDYRDRERDRNGGGGGSGGGGSGGGGGGSGGGARRDSYRNMGGNGGHQQRDFRLGHRDNRVEDSRGGFDRTTLPPTSNMSNYKDPAQTSGGNSGYDQYKNNGAQAKVNIF